MTKAYIVWNAGRTEGVVFTGEEGRDDALQTVRKEFGAVSSSIGEAFAEAYDDDELTLQEIDLP